MHDNDDFDDEESIDPEQLNDYDDDDGDAYSASRGRKGTGLDARRRIERMMEIRQLREYDVFVDLEELGW